MTGAGGAGGGGGAAQVLVGMVRTALLGMLMAALVVQVARRVLVAPVGGVDSGRDRRVVDGGG